MGTIAVGQITITDLMDGAPGQNGIAASLTSDTHVVPTDVNGNNGFYTGCSSTIELYEGGKKLTTGVAYSFAPASGITGTGNTGTGTYTVTTMSVDASYVDLKATYQGSTYVKRFTVTKAKQGSTGSQGIPGTPGSNGQSLYTWVKYADDALGNGMSDNPNGKKYIGLAYNKTTATESTNKADYEWTLISNQTMLNNYSISGDISYGWQNAAGFSLVASDEIGYYGNLRTSGNEMQISEMIEIEPSKSYKISLAIKNPETDATNKGSWYFGIYAYDKNKNSIGTYINNGVVLDDNPYFHLQSRVSASFNWTTYEGYVHAYNIDTAKTIPKGNCSTYLRFDKKCKYIRIRFLNYRSVTGNYGDGKLGSFYYAHPTITAVDSSALTNNSEDVFNALTNNGAIQGIYMKDGQLYINGQYINAKNLSVTNSGGTKTFYIDQSGNVSINANSLSIVAGGSGNIPTKNDVTDSINNITIGGRNLISDERDIIKNTAAIPAYDKETHTWTITAANGEGGQWGAGLRIGGKEVVIPYGQEYIVSFEIKVPVACNWNGDINNYAVEGDSWSGNDNDYTNLRLTSSKSLEPNKWIKCWFSFVNKHPLNTELKDIYDNSNFGVVNTTGSNMTYQIRKIKGELGNKPSDWSQCPDDVQSEINNKVNVGGTIDDINQSPNGQISYPKLNITGAISFDDLASEMSENFIAKKDASGNRIQTVINGRTIEAGTVTADKLNAYELNITKRRLENGKWIDTTIPTFNISQEGLIQASGTFKSFDFIGDVNNLGASENGWIITDTGESVFNNSIIRGRVELPNAGITDYGGGTIYNLLKDTDFRELQEKTDIGWDNALNGTYNLYWWGGYNSGVTDPSHGYHARVDTTTFQFNTLLFRNKNSEIGQTNRWMGASGPINANILKANNKYTFAIDIYFTSVGQKIYGGLYHKLTDNATNAFNSGQYTFISTADHVNKWTRFTWTFTTNSKLNPATSSSWYVYGYGGTEGDVFVNRLKLEEGTIATPYASTADVAKKEVRMYAGSDYYNRYNAPFKVLQDGTIIASRGEFGGTFTGKIEIGNIIIEDTTTSYGTIKINNNDNSKTIVQISDDKSFFNSQLNLGTEENPHFRYMPSAKTLESLEGSSIVFNTKGNKKMRIDNGQYGTEVLMGDIISVSGEVDRLNVNSAAGGKFTVAIGNFADASTADDVFVDIDGSARVRNMTIAGGKFYESVDGTGVDLFIE